MAVAWKLAATAAAIYAAFSLGLYVFQGRLVYFPHRPIAFTPKTVGLDYEDVWLRGTDDKRLHGWLLPAPAGAATVLFFHGNAGNISHRLDTLQVFHALGLGAFIIDYPGYGNSEGRPGERATYDSAEAAWHYLTATRGLRRDQIVVFGRSLGAGVATWLAERESPRALIIESAFTSVPDLAAQIYPVFPVRLLARIRYDNEARMPGIRVPVLIAHSRRDEMIGFAHGERLFAAANEPKTFLEMRGGHNDGFEVSGEAYVRALADFLRSTERVENSPEPAENK